MLRSVLCESITGRAVDRGLFCLNFINIRDYSADRHRRVDDAPYGGGGGMIMQAEPVVRAYEDISAGLDYKPYCVYLSPQGKLFNQETAKHFALELSHIVLLCGHYEGIDERIIEEIVDMELSIGDYVLTGGELPAAVVVDAVARLLPGVLSSPQAYENESIHSGYLEHPQYTRPAEFMGRTVPEVLLSGHHKNIEEWKKEQSVERTKKKRPDLLKNEGASDE